ncbi:MAG TPA: methyltransferase domain-containing protein [Ktedonobacterales bacterium]
MGTDSNMWSSGTAYEVFIGRWSRLVAREFLAWLSVPRGRSWLDVGCGTGALSQAILSAVEPSAVRGVDPSEGYIAGARVSTPDPRATFVVGDAQALPVESGAYDVVVSGLVLNFVPDPAQAVAEMARVATPGGTVAVYVWDYADQMRLLRHFWDAAVALDPRARDLDEGSRFTICQPDSLARLVADAGRRGVLTRAIDVPTVFRDFDDYWSPFLGGQGPAPSYVASLDDEQRAALRKRVRASLPVAADGSIALIARAWAVRGSR